jgi:hypothetical protein
MSKTTSKKPAAEAVEPIIPIKINAWGWYVILAQALREDIHGGVAVPSVKDPEGTVWSAQPERVGDEWHVRVHADPKKFQKAFAQERLDRAVESFNQKIGQIKGYVQAFANELDSKLASGDGSAAEARSRCMVSSLSSKELKSLAADMDANGFDAAAYFASAAGDREEIERMQAEYEVEAKEFERVSFTIPYSSIKGGDWLVQ